MRCGAAAFEQGAQRRAERGELSAEILHLFWRVRCRRRCRLRGGWRCRRLRGWCCGGGRRCGRWRGRRRRGYRRRRFVRCGRWCSSFRLRFAFFSLCRRRIRCCRRCWRRGRSPLRRACWSGRGVILLLPSVDELELACVKAVAGPNHAVFSRCLHLLLCLLPRSLRILGSACPPPALIFLVPFLPDGEPDGLCAAAVGAAASCDRPPFVVGSSMPSIGRKVTARSGVRNAQKFFGEHLRDRYK